MRLRIEYDRILIALHKTSLSLSLFSLSLSLSLYPAFTNKAKRCVCPIFSPGKQKETQTGPGEFEVQNPARQSSSHERVAAVFAQVAERDDVVYWYLIQ